MGNVTLYKSVAGYAATMAAYDAALARWPVPYESLKIPTRYGRTHLIASGEPGAPPLVLLGGAGSNATRWLPNVADLSRAFRVYAVDGLGESGRSAGVRPSYRGTCYAEWLIDLFDGLDLDRPNVAGISRGGWLALKIASTAPARVERVVALSAQGLAPLTPKFLLLMLRVQIAPTEKNIRRLERFSSAPTLPVNERMVERLRLIFRHYRSNLAVVPNFTDNDLRRISAPALLLWGEYEKVFDVPKASLRAMRLIPDVQSEVIPDAGHTLTDDQPAVVDERIIRFILSGDPVKSSPLTEEMLVNLAA